MEMAKVTSKGQITIPVSIRKRLGIKEGDKILFLDTADGVMMVNPDVRPADVSAENRRETENIGQALHSAVDAAGLSGVPEPAGPVIMAFPEPEKPRENAKPPLHENQYDVNKLLDEIRSFREKY